MLPETQAADPNRLAQQIAFYKGLIDSSYEWEYMLSPTGEFTYVSPAVECITGYSPEAFYGHVISIESLLHPEDREAYRVGLLGLGDKQRFDCRDLRIITRQGELKWLNHRCHLVMNPDGESAGIRGSFMSLSNRESYEVEITKQREAMHALLNATDESAVLIDLDYTILDMNDLAAKRFGHTRQEMLGRYSSDFIPEELAFSRKQVLAQVRETKKPLVHHDERGGMIFENRVYPVIDTSGEVYQFAIYAKDITEKRQAEMHLQESEQKFKSLFASSPDAILLADKATGLIVDANPAAAKLFETDLSEIIGMHQADLHPTDQNEQARTEFNREPKPHEDVPPPLEIDIVTAKQHTKSVEIRGIAFFMDQKEYVLGNFRDITDRKKLENELQQKQDELTAYKQRLEQTLTGTTSGTFTHDFQTGYLHFDEVGAKIIGLRESKIPYEDYYAYVHADDRVPLYRRIAKQFANCEPNINQAYRLVPRGDETPHVELKAFVEYRDGKPYRTYGIVSDITKQEQLAKELSSTKDQLAEFIASSPARMLFIRLEQPMPLAMDAEGRYRWMKQYGFIEDCNEACAKQFGYPDKEDLIGLSGFEFFHQNEELFRGVVERYGQYNYRVTDLETTEISQHGEILYFLDNSHPVIQDGRLHAIHITSANITKQKRLEQQLTEYQNRLTHFFQMNPVGMYYSRFRYPMPVDLPMAEQLDWIRDHLIIRDANDALARQYGFSHKDQVIGLSFFQLIGEREDLFREIVHAYEGVDQGPVINVETHFVNRLGEEVYQVSNRVSIVEDEHLLGLYGVQLDVTQERKARAQVQQAQERLEFFVNDNPASIFTFGLKEPMPMALNAEERFQWFKQHEYIAHCNDTFARGMGVEKREELIGMTFYELYGGNEEILRKIAAPGIENDFRFSNRVMEGVSLTGEANYLMSTAIPIIQDGLLHEAFVITQDITKKKVLEEELQASLATKDKLFSIISHDLRSPMASILGSMDLLANAIEENDRAFMQRMIGLLKDSTANTYELLENLLIWARSQRNTLSFQPKTLPLSDIVKDTLVLPTQIATQKGIRLSVQLDDNSQVHVDRQMVHTIVRNLLSNAIKFTREGGSITVAIQPNGETVALSVADTGTGMSEQQLQRLFKREGTSSKLGTNGEAGSGLGLLLCHEFALKNQGKIEVESEEGKGSTFTVTLPLVKGITQ